VWTVVWTGGSVVDSGVESDVDRWQWCGQVAVVYFKTVFRLCLEGYCKSVKI
jgi:hypothetical protein